MLLVVEKGETRPVNLGSGTGVTVKRIVEIVAANLDKKPKIVWDKTKPAGDKVRLMDISRARSLGFEPKTSIEEGIADAMAWHRANKSAGATRYNVFTESKLMGSKIKP